MTKITYFIATGTDLNNPFVFGANVLYLDAVQQLKKTLATALPITQPVQVVDLDQDKNPDKLSTISTYATEFKHLHLILCPTQTDEGITVAELQSMRDALHAANQHNKLIITLITSSLLSSTADQIAALYSKILLADELVVLRSDQASDLMAAYAMAPAIQNKLQEAIIIPFPNINAVRNSGAQLPRDLLGFEVADAYHALIRDSLLPPPLATKREGDTVTCLVSKCSKQDLFQYVYYQGPEKAGKCEGQGKLLLFRPLSKFPLLIDAQFENGSLVRIVSSHLFADSPYCVNALNIFKANSPLSFLP